MNAVPTLPTRTSTELAIRFAAALQAAGAPTWRVEAGVARVGAALGLNLRCMSTPTGLWVEGPEGIRMETCRPADPDLRRQGTLEALLQDLELGRNTAQELMTELLRLKPAPPLPFHQALLAHLLVGQGALQLWGGTLEESAVVALSSIGVVSLERLAILGSQRRVNLGRLLPLLSGLLAAGLAANLATVFPLDLARTTVAALVVVLPGFTFTVGMAELATGHLSAGTARLAGAALSLLQLSLGAAFGWAIAAPLTQVTEVGTALASVGTLPSVLGTGMALGLLFRARLREVPWVMAGALLAYILSSLTGDWLGNLGSTFLAAGCVGIAGNLRSRWTGGAAQAITVPGVLLLVPGAVGFGALRAFLLGNTLQGVDQLFAMGMCAMAIVGGLLAATLLVSPGPNRVFEPAT
jgi:uncharacterized membrane protein YjjP (DUF1212 family)